MRIMDILMRPTTIDDLSYVIQTETHEENSKFVSSQNRQKHLDYLKDKDISHLIVEADKKPIGYIILAGLNDKNENIEFRRIVIGEKGKGYGRKALRLAKDFAFEKLNAHRFWLDVFEFNKRARHLYESEGFSVEGVFRECVKSENGRESIVYMSMLRREYQED